LERSIQTGSTGESHLRKVFAYLTSAYSRLNQLEKALDAVDRGLQEFAMDEELRFRRANLLLELGRHQEAAATFQHLLSKQEERHITSVMQGLSGHMARSQLAITYSAMGQFHEALVQWVQVTKEAPWYRTGWRGYIETLLKQGQHQQAADLVQAAHPLRQLPGECEYLLGNIHVAVSDLPRAAYWYEQAVEHAPQDEVILERTARFYFESGPAHKARPYLERLIALNPKDAAALHNLGAVYLDAKDYIRARECLQQSLLIRPDAKQTQELLAVTENTP
ncbi:MAG TPA: tetratricopeptide repeat protein, partial [Gemmatales bacterium]|nr:tetratricopeptide repeat protein [Gemmatales bacterium]